MVDDENEAPKANKIADEWLVIDEDETLNVDENQKARKVLYTLRQLGEENPGWA